jgi:hypothetical protein
MVCVNCEGIFVDDPEQGIVPALERPATPEKPRSDQPSLKLRDTSPTGPPQLPTGSDSVLNSHDEDAPIAAVNGGALPARDRVMNGPEEEESTSGGNAKPGEAMDHEEDGTVEGRLDDYGMAGRVNVSRRWFWDDEEGERSGGRVDEQGTLGLEAPGSGLVKDGRDRVSGALASKMLEGWALLAEHCPM